ncbi:hypothetical protein AB1Y20_010174 [Prymnesium parvum]|uniref:Peptidyl-prolyl cis-trans isomerase n=1 Tax=Prymnesium parvum TaxID=97485 RepID=A0AB34K772_PRYPA
MLALLASALAFSAAPIRSARHEVARSRTVSCSGVDRRAAIWSLAAVGASFASEGSLAAGEYPKVKVTTTAGDMEFELWDDVAPKHTASFLKLAQSGFYDGGAFHRIIPGFVIQGGDPNAKVGYGPSGTLEDANAGQVKKWGTGGPGYTVPAEFNERPHEFGVLSMARSADPNSAGSQFFVCLGTLPFLDRKYTTFGKLLSGDETLRKLASAKTVKGDIPFTRQGIEKVQVL